MRMPRSRGQRFSRGERGCSTVIGGVSLSVKKQPKMKYDQEKKIPVSKLSIVYGLMNADEKLAFRKIALLGVVAAIVETLGATSIMPFVALLSSSAQTELPIFLSETFDFLGIVDRTQVIKTVGVFCIAIFLFALSLKLFASIQSQKFIRNKEAKLSAELLEKYLSPDYLTIIQRSSADYGRLMLSEVNRVVSHGVGSLLTMLVQASLCLALTAGVLYINLTVGLIALSVIMAVLVSFRGLQKGKLGIISREISLLNRKRYETFLEAFGSVREIKIYGLEYHFLSRYSDEMSKYRDYLINSFVLVQTARIAIEALTFGGIVILALYLLAQDSQSQILPLLAFYAYAA